MGLSVLDLQHLLDKKALRDELEELKASAAKSTTIPEELLRWAKRLAERRKAIADKEYSDWVWTAEENTRKAMESDYAAFGEAVIDLICRTTGEEAS